MPDHSQRDWPAPVETLNPNGASRFVLTCEHASNHLPAEYQRLGLPEAELQRHIAWDIGAAAVTRIVSKQMDAAAFLSSYSRLLIDLNRPLSAESSIPIRSENTDIPGNINLPVGERQKRAERMFYPFHEAVSAHLDVRRQDKRPTLIAAIHSFTPVFRGVQRPWHAGILYDRDEGYGKALIRALSVDGDLNVAANQPYTIERESDYTVPIHGEDRDIPAVLIEIRQDLISDDAGVAIWAERLAQALNALQVDLIV